MSSSGHPDPTRLLRQLHTEVTVVTGTAYSQHATAQLEPSTSGQASWNQSFGLLFTGGPGAQVSFVASVGGRSYPSSVSVTDSLEITSSISLVVQTAHVYFDSPTVAVVYQLRDFLGNGKVSQSGLNVVLDVFVSSLPSYTASSACVLPDGTGIGYCSLSVPSGWFTSTEDLQLSVKMYAMNGLTRLANSTAASVVMKSYPLKPVLQSAGMTLSLPLHPVFRGDSFSVSITANTNGNAMTTWVVTASFDSNVLSFVSLDTGSAYIDAVYNANSNSVKISTSGLQSGYSDSDVTGPEVSIVTLTFQVQSGAAVGLASSAISLLINDMVNENSLSFASAIAGVVYDAFGSASSSGQVTVVDTGYAGILAYSSNNELVNTSPLTGATVTVPVTVLGVPNKNGAATSVVTSASSCVGHDPLVASVASCTVSLSNSHSLGTSNLLVSVHFLGLNASVSFRVWYPTEVAVTVDDSALGRVAIGSVVMSCLEYQQTLIRALVTVGVPGLPSKQVYMTNLVTFQLSDSTVASVNGNVLSGKNVGTVTVSPVVDHALPIVLGTATVTVGASTVNAVSLSVIALTSYSGSPDQLSVNRYSSALLSFVAHQSLTAEGQTANIVVYANFDDGHYWDVTRVARVWSTNSSVSVSTDGFGPVVSVLKNAVSVCGNVLMASWGFCGVNVTSPGALVVTLPAATSVTLTLSNDVLTYSSDKAAVSPFNVATSSTLGITVHYSDGSSRSFSSPLDSRASISVTSGSSLVSVTDNLIQVTALGVFGSATVSVSFPGMYTVSASVSLSIVKFSALSLASYSYPDMTPPKSIHVLHKLGCTDIYQHVSVTATGTLSNGVTGDLSSVVSFVSSKPAIAAFVPSTTHLAGLSAGNTSVTAVYSTFHSPALNISVVPTHVHVTSIVVSLPSAVSGTFVAVVNATAPLQVSLTFDDGTVYNDVVSGPSSAWVGSSQLVYFNSSKPRVIAVDSSGHTELLSNYYSTVDLSVRASCSSAPIAIASLYANLYPNTFDADFGNDVTAPFGIQSIGSDFIVPVRVMTGPEGINGFQLLITFDPSVIKLASDGKCVKGADWTNSFECTTNNPINQVLIVGYCSGASCSAINAPITVATLSFTPVATGESLISGWIQKVQSATAMVSGLSVVAGKDKVVIAATLLDANYLPSSGESEHFDSLYSESATATRPATHRALSPCTACLHGDTNGDCVFDVSDVVYLQQYIVGSVSSINSCQKSAMDPDLNNIINAVDIQYLGRVLVKKYRFVNNLHLSNSSGYGIVNASATLYDETQALASSLVQIQYEFKSGVNKAMPFSVAGATVVTYSGVLATALEVSTGTYTVVASPQLSEHGVGVVMIMTTFDQLGSSSISRQFSFYCSPTIAACVSIYGSQDAAFKPFKTIDLVAATRSPSMVPSSSAPTARPSAVPRTPSARPTDIPFVAPSSPTSIPSSYPTFNYLGK